MRIAVASDHGGWKLKERLVRFLADKGHKIYDFGTYSEDSCDYPVYAAKAAEAVAGRQCARAVLICKSGIGNCIVANKVPGVRAALVHNLDSAKFCRLHNDANVLVLGAKFVKPEAAKRIASLWLRTEFEGGRHLRRVKQISAIERKYSKKLK